MGGLQYAGYIIPILLLLVFLEYLLSRIKKKEVYSFSDTVVNVSCGLLERLFDLFFIVFLHFLFQFFFEKVAPWKIPWEGLNFYGKAAVWIAALFVGDFLAYWHHRLSHEINVFWAAHIVHHQSEELNMTTVFRVSAFAVINRTFFWIWLPIIGFNPGVSTSIIVFIGLYQFLTHTRLVGKLGILEYFLVTPSHHRVHHARNEQYIDKNYGHVFIIWDKMLGTFEPEGEEPEFGIISGFESSNPYWAYFAYWVDLFRRALKAKHWKNKIKIFFTPPAWENPDVPLEKNHFDTDQYGNRKKYKLKVPKRIGIYTMVNVLLTIGLFVFLIFTNSKLHIFITLTISFFIAFSILSFGPIMERKKWGLYIDYVRLTIMLICLPLIIWSLSIEIKWLIFGLLIVLGLVLWLWGIRHYFEKTSNNIEEAY